MAQQKEGLGWTCRPCRVDPTPSNSLRDLVRAHPLRPPDPDALGRLHGTQVRQAQVGFDERLEAVDGDR